MSTEDAPGVKLRQEIVAVPAYKQGRAAPADGFKLSSNENPFPPLPSRGGCGGARSSAT